MSRTKQVFFEVAAKDKTGQAFDRLRNNLRGINQQAASITKSMRLAGGAAALLGGVGLVGALQQVKNYADAAKELDNRLKLATGSERALADARAAVYDISKRTRAAVEGVGQTYQRLSQNADQLQLSQADVARTTETVSKLVALSGASAEGAKAGLLQFSQGLATGQIRGEELNSVMEQLPALASAIAEGLGVPTGKLRDMGKAGEITAEKVVAALEKMQSKVDEQFSSLDPTVAQSYTALNNRVQELIGSADRFIGASGAWAKVVQGLANNLDTLLVGVSALAVVALPALAQAAIPATIVALNALKAAALSNPIILGATAIAGAAMLIYEFREEILQAVPALGELGAMGKRAIGFVSDALDFAITAFKSLGITGESVMLGLENALRFYSDVASGLFELVSLAGIRAFELLGADADTAAKGMGGSFADFARAAAQVMDNFYDTFNSIFMAIGAGASALGKTIKAAISNPIAAAFAFIESQVNDALKSINWLARQSNAIFDTGFGQMGLLSFGKASDFGGVDVWGAMNDALLSAGGSTYWQDAVQGVLDKTNSTRAKVEKPAKPPEDLDLTEPPALSGGGKGTAAKVQEDVDKLGDFINRQLSRRAQEYQRFIDKITGAEGRALTEQKLAWLEHARSVGDITQSQFDKAFSALFKSAHQDLYPALKEVNSAMRSLGEGMEAAMKKGTDAVTDFVLGTQTSFGRMFEQIAHDMAGTMVRNQIAKPLMSGLMNFASTGIANLFGGSDPLGALINLKGWASGGYTGSGGKYEPAGVVHRGEYVFSKEATSRIGVDNLARLHRGYADGGYVGNAAAGGSSVAVHVHNNGSNKVDVQQRQEGGGLRLDVIIEQIDRAMGGRISEGQGAVSAAISNRFGLAPTMG